MPTLDRPSACNVLPPLCLVLIFSTNLKLMFSQTCSNKMQYILLTLLVYRTVGHATKKVKHCTQGLPISTVTPFALLHKSNEALPQKHRLPVSKVR